MYTKTITVDGIPYKMIGYPYVTNIGAPAEAIYVWPCVRAEEMPDECGCLDMYEFRYSIPGIDEEFCAEWYNPIDWDCLYWECPYDVVETKYSWLEEEQRRI